MPESAPDRGTLLSFDYGARRIGVAVGQTLTATANPLETVSNGREPDWAAIGRLVREWRPDALLVGLPLGAEGEETGMSKAARRFGRSLSERYGLPVEFADERLTSRAAEGRFRAGRAAGSLKKKHSGQLDAMAAQIILENWLQSRHG